MNENQATQSAVEADPLAMPASSANTDYPVLKEGNKRLTIRKMELVDPSDDAKKKGAPADGKNLKITLELPEDASDVNDNKIYKGFTLTKFIPLYISGERKSSDIQRDVGTFVKAVEGKNSTTPLSEVRDNPDKFLGKPVDCKIGINKETAQFPMSNSVRFMIPS